MLGHGEFDMHENRHLLIEGRQPMCRREDVEVISKQIVYVSADYKDSCQGTDQSDHETY